MANPEITNNDPRQIEVFAPIYKQLEITVAGALTLAKGTVLAYSAANNDYRVAASGVADTANARAILPVETIFSGAGSAFRNCIIEGEVYDDKLVFDGADDLDTIPAASSFDLVSFREQLKTAGIIVRASVEMRELDNQ